MRNSELILKQVEKSDQYQRYQEEFEILTKKLVAKELEFANLQHKLARFEQVYIQIVGVLLAELDELEVQIAREVTRLNPTEDSRKNYQRAERRANASHESVRKNRDKEGSKELTPSKELKEIFLKVAKTIHPDLAANEGEIAYRTNLMAKANDAYQNGDYETLNQILDEWEQKVCRGSFKDDGLNKMQQLQKKKVKEALLKNWSPAKTTIAHPAWDSFGFTLLTGQ